MTLGKLPAALTKKELAERMERSSLSPVICADVTEDSFTAVLLCSRRQKMKATLTMGDERNCILADIVSH